MGSTLRVWDAAGNAADVWNITIPYREIFIKEELRMIKQDYGIMGADAPLFNGTGAAAVGA
jgi:hypothetical protein